MPLPKSLLQRPVRRTSTSSSTDQSQRKRCRMCNNLDPRGHTSSIYPNDHEKDTKACLTLLVDAVALSNIKDISARRCRFCHVVVQALDAFFEEWRGTGTKICIELREKATIKVSIDSLQRRGEIIELYAGSASRAPWPTLGTTHHIPVDSGSDETFDFIRRAIRDCVANPKHAACRLSCESSIPAPKRLLDVGRAASPIHLIDTQGKSLEYAALSHCWGSGPRLITTKSNWASLSTNIPFNALSPLFQDAILITRQLGLRYIWIDSLCIIQDSLRDWETESSNMGSIYENSYVTISATNSGDGSARCLSERQKPVKISYENTAKKEFSLRARRVLDHHPSSGPCGSSAEPMGPLSSRAWALQEHVLSTRILHYTATELLFECRTSYRCECMTNRKAFSTTPSLIPKAVASKKTNAVHEAWQRIVEKYSARDLTIDGDKLPAISGIADKIRKATHSEYLAGLWKSNLASDLLWTTPDLAPKTNRFALETWRAPSFSWASLDTAVIYPQLDDEEREAFRPTVSLLEMRTVPKGLNSLGTLMEAWIKVRGPTMEATLSSDQDCGIWKYTLILKDTSTIISVTPDCLLVDTRVKNETWGDEKGAARRAKPDDSLSNFEVSVLCLSVARQDNLIFGLVLAMSERLPNAWERLGIFAAGTENMQSAQEREVMLV